MGKSDDNMDFIDIRAMRQGPQLQQAQRETLVAPISSYEIYAALKGINDLAAPGLDGYSAKKFQGQLGYCKRRSHSYC